MRRTWCKILVLASSALDEARTSKYGELDGRVFTTCWWKSAICRASAGSAGSRRRRQSPPHRPSAVAWRCVRRRLDPLQSFPTPRRARFDQACATPPHLLDNPHFEQPSATSPLFCDNLHFGQISKSVNHQSRLTLLEICPKWRLPQNRGLVADG